MSGKQNILAIALCVLFSAALIGMYVHEKIEQAYNYEVYQRVLPERERRQAELNARKEALAARREAARLDYLNATETNLPGIVFYSDGLMEDTGSGMEYRATVSSLVRSEVCNPATVSVDIRNSPDISAYATYFPIVFVGGEVSLSDPENMVAVQRQYIAGHDRYIVVGATTGNREQMSALEAAMTAAHGDKYINIREYMSTDGLPSLELEITDFDRAAMAEGRIPPSLLKSDGIHLNDNGTRLLAYMTYDKMSELGYFDEIIAAKEIYDEAEEATIND